MSGINIRPMDPELLFSCMQIAPKMRTEAQDNRDYAAERARRRPWIPLSEAGHELDLSQGRISQLISRGTLTVRRDPDRPGCKQVRAADVYAYSTNPIKKTRTKQ